MEQGICARMRESSEGKEGFSFNKYPLCVDLYGWDGGGGRKIQKDRDIYISLYIYIHTLIADSQLPWWLRH